MQNTLEQLHASLQARDLKLIRAICHEVFSCQDGAVDVLLEQLTAYEFYTLFSLLLDIRKSPADERPSKALGIPLLLGNQKDHVLEAAQEIYRGLPISPLSQG